MELCVSLDHADKGQNLALARQMVGLPVWLKVGFRSFIRDGRSLIDELKAIDSGFKIFLDLKLYDIPNTMADAAEEIALLGVDMFNVHASAGTTAMHTVMERLAQNSTRPLVLAVTALTSFSDEAFRAVYHEGIVTCAPRFAHDAYTSGLDGVVCSVFESRSIKEATSPSFLTLTPGIRPFGEAANDQARVADLATAREEKSDIIVVGRPIYTAQEPVNVARAILEAI